MKLVGKRRQGGSWEIWSEGLKKVAFCHGWRMKDRDMAETRIQ